MQHRVTKFVKSLAAGRLFFTGTPVFSTNKTDRRDIAEILLKLTKGLSTNNYYILAINRQNVSVNSYTVS